jgi:hypothetical protein
VVSNNNLVYLKIVMFFKNKNRHFKSIDARVSLFQSEGHEYDWQNEICFEAAGS